MLQLFYKQLYVSLLATFTFDFFVILGKFMHLNCQIDSKLEPEQVESKLFLPPLRNISHGNSFYSTVLVHVIVLYK